MKLLLDTHVVLWCLSAPSTLQAEARSAIEDPENTVFVSAASAWEMEIKRSLGKLDTPEDLEAQLATRRFTELPVRLRHARALRTLPSLHRDPFDRLLLAQAIVDGLVVVSRDQRLLEYPVKSLRA